MIKSKEQLEAELITWNQFKQHKELHYIDSMALALALILGLVGVNPHVCLLPVVLAALLNYYLLKIENRQEN